MKKFFKNHGFTLFELLAVLAILAIIAGIAVPRVMQTIKNARIQAIRSEMQLVANSVQRMLMEAEIMNSREGFDGGVFTITSGSITTSPGSILKDKYLETFPEYIKVETTTGSGISGVKIIVSYFDPPGFGNVKVEDLATTGSSFTIERTVEFTTN